MTTKEEAVKHLIGLKYPAELVDGVVVIRTRDPMPKVQKERIRRELRAIGYRGSWGWRIWLDS